MKSIIGFLNNSNLHAIISTSLKVVCNETGGGSGGWLLFEDGFGPWRSMSVYFLKLPSSFLRSISVSFVKPSY
jgi:hypothetical protein